MRRDRLAWTSRGTSCASVRETVSAGLDGEDGPLASVEVADHLDACPACARFADLAPDVTRTTRVAAATPVPDLTAPILVAVTEQGVLGDVRRIGRLRLLVALAGAVQLLLAVPALVGVAALPVHAGRELGSLQLALAFGFLVAAWQPRRAAGVLPVAAVVGLAVLVTGVLDVTAGSASLVAELGHLGEIVGLLALWQLTRVSHEASQDHEPLLVGRPVAQR